MPLLTPKKHRLTIFRPFQRQPRGKAFLAFVERQTKGPLFGCRMCGNCLLQETAFICPMGCPKGLRNGPCGGSTPEKCYVDENSPCVWYHIYDRAFRMGREDKLLEVLPPLDWNQVGNETWGGVFERVKMIGWRKVARGLLATPERAATWENIFRPIRQPDWWQGDSAYHPPAYAEPVSELERRLKAGEFVVTAEVSPPRDADTARMRQNVELVKPFVTAINFVDNPSATPRMSSLACAQIARELGAEPVLQIAARDRTRTGLQSEVMGASGLGLRNLLCISGDHSKMGPAPMGRGDVVDLDAVQMLWILRRMRDEAIYLGGQPIKNPPRYFLGAAASPMASEPRFQALREQKKVNAGAQFFQTNVIFDADALETWLNELAKRDVLGKVYILVGITPLRSLKMAQFMSTGIPGIQVPAAVLQRMEAAGDGAGEVGVQIALELIERVRSLQGVNGIHLMPVTWEAIVPRLVQEAGLLPAPARQPEPEPTL